MAKIKCFVEVYSNGEEVIPSHKAQEEANERYLFEYVEDTEDMSGCSSGFFSDWLSQNYYSYELFHLNDAQKKAVWDKFIEECKCQAWEDFLREFEVIGLEVEVDTNKVR